MAQENDPQHMTHSHIISSLEQCALTAFTRLPSKKHEDGQEACGKGVQKTGSCCGVVINLVDGGVLFTVCKIALQLDTCSAKYAEIEGCELLPRTLSALLKRQETGV